MTVFTDLNLIKPLLRALEDQGYSEPTPIQAKAIPAVLDNADVLGLAQTGTGKTAAFTLPMLQRLAADDARPAARSARALVLAPTRELAAQIGDAVRDYGRHLRLRHTVVFGGVRQGPQVRAMQRGVDILIATPGRLMDLMTQGHVRLGSVEFFVLDEADRMLDLGFIQPIRKIAAALPKTRQTLLFSATMPDAIARLAASLQDDPVRLEAARVSSTVSLVDQQMLFVAKTDKRALLEHVVRGAEVTRVLVFTRTKRGADRVMRQLDKSGIPAAAIHGDKSQGARESALKAFRQGRVRVLIATDIAARGIDIDGISHVINFDMPDTPEAYVHRIGRTARAGADGVALSFCDETEAGQLRDIERTIGLRVPVDSAHPYHADVSSRAGTVRAKPGNGQKRPRDGRNDAKRHATHAKTTASTPKAPKRRTQSKGKPAPSANPGDGSAKRNGKSNNSAAQSTDQAVGVMRTLFPNQRPAGAAGHRARRGRRYQRNGVAA